MSLLLVAALSVSLIQPDCPSKATEFQWPMPDGRTIAGTLRQPLRTDTSAVVVYVSGAGPQDRDYFTVGPSMSPTYRSYYRTLQDRLLCEGVGSLIFDEVGTGASSGSYADIATTEVLAGDVIEYQYTSHNRLYGIAIDQLKARHEQRLASDRWYQFFLKFDPSPYYARVRSPVLILHGEKDTDVTALQADSILTLLSNARQTTAQCVRYSDTDHTFTDMEYNQWLPHLASIEEIVRFVQSGYKQLSHTDRCQKR